MVSRSRAFRSGALDAGGAGVSAEIFLLSVWGRRAGLYRRTLCLDGGRAGVGCAGAEMEAAVGSWAEGGAAAADHVADKVRDADDCGFAVTHALLPAVSRLI